MDQDGIRKIKKYVIIILKRFAIYFQRQYKYTELGKTEREKKPHPLNAMDNAGNLRSPGNLKRKSKSLDFQNKTTRVHFLQHQLPGFPRNREKYLPTNFNFDNHIFYNNSNDTNVKNNNVNQALFIVDYTTIINLKYMI